MLKNQKQSISLPFENFYNTGGIILPVEINGKPIKAALDTGSPHTGINWKAAKLAGIEKDSAKLHKYEVKAHGLNAKEPITVNETGFNISLEKGKLFRTDNKVRINDIHALKQIFGNDPSMILGLPFFEQRRLVIDYANSKLYISEKPQSSYAVKTGV